MYASTVVVEIKHYNTESKFYLCVTIILCMHTMIIYSKYLYVEAFSFCRLSYVILILRRTSMVSTIKLAYKQKNKFKIIIQIYYKRVFKINIEC
jgi:DMSO reductase anchor subunit